MEAVAVATNLSSSQIKSSPRVNRARSYLPFHSRRHSRVACAPPGKQKGSKARADEVVFLDRPDESVVGLLQWFRRSARTGPKASRYWRQRIGQVHRPNLSPIASDPLKGRIEFPIPPGSSRAAGPSEKSACPR